ncbi:hypothetical protein [Helicobacter pylori]|uniref:hypothetical protein n=1 Tax=Helicobacter pylori TaxID=210 RepID=UPI00165A22BB|nr:hypothetical protein [Helicobacter pylori]
MKEIEECWRLNNMAAPLLALPFLFNPLVLGALAVIGTGAYMILKGKTGATITATRTIRFESAIIQRKVSHKYKKH